MEQLYLDAKPLWVKRMAYFRGLLSMQNNYGGEFGPSSLDLKTLHNERTNIGGSPHQEY